MKWSANDEWGTTFLTEGMWQATHPLVGFTGHVAGPVVSDTLVGSDRGREPPERAVPEWHERHLAS
jgi:hypothetical protein